MKLCDDGHDEVCYEVKYCPVCKKQEEIKDLKKEIEELENIIGKLREEIFDLLDDEPLAEE